MRSFFTIAIFLNGLIGLVGAGTASAEHELHVGVRTTALHLEPPEGQAGEMDLAGGGLQARWRFLPHWGIELSLDALHGELAGGAFVRDSGAFTVSVMWHIVEAGGWDMYVLGGIGATADKISLTGRGGSDIEQTFDESHAHFGVGLEYLWCHWGLGVEVRAVGLQRKDKDEARMGDAVPPKTAGGQGSITVGYYF